jgi:hypothetical protein
MTSHIFKARGLPDLKAGNRCVYHVGFLAIDRVEDSALDRVGKAFLELSEKGLVYLFQRKLGPSRYSYEAVGSRRYDALQEAEREDSPARRPVDWRNARVLVANETSPTTAPARGS